MADHYVVLGIDRNALPGDILKAYRKMAKKYHPDTGEAKDDEMFKKVLGAYEVLKDPLKKQEYDDADAVLFIKEPLDYARKVWQKFIPEER